MGLMARRCAGWVGRVGVLLVVGVLVSQTYSTFAAEAPVILGLDFPSSVEVGEPESGGVRFADGDENMDRAFFDSVAGGFPDFTLTVSSNLVAGDRFEGELGFRLECVVAERIVFRVTLQDTTGLRSEPTDLRFKCKDAATNVRGTIAFVDESGQALSGIVPSGSFYLRVEDPDQNFNPFVSEALTVTLLGDPFNGTVRVTLVERTPDSGQFRSAALRLGDFPILALKAGQTLIARYQDPDNIADRAQAKLDLLGSTLGLPLQPGVRRNVIVVKFQEGTDIRLRDGQLVSFTGLDLGALEDVLQRYVLVTIAPLFGEPEDALDRQRQQLRGAPGPPLLDFNLFYVIETENDAQGTGLLTALQTLSLVEDARFYQHPLVQPAPEDDGLKVAAALDVSSAPQASGDGTPNFQTQQGYLGAAPDGVDALFAHGLPGGQGQGVRVLDLELGWNVRHEDLRCCFVQEGTMPTGGDEVNHGTAVLGVIAGQQNDRGITGIAPQAELGVVSWYEGLVAERIKQAAQRLRAGDVLLIEGQIAHPSRPESCGALNQDGCLPLEVDPANFNALNFAVKRGVVVVEAAGNSGLNMDDRQNYGGRLDRYLSRNAPNFEDSGAIFVGAGAPAKHRLPARLRLSFSNFGSRVDVQAWGRLVTTLGGPLFRAPWYNNLFDGGSNRRYTKSFAGTSSAAAIVAGVVASIEGTRLQSSKTKPLTSRQVRELLVETGTPQVGAKGAPATQHIGPLPDLKAANAQVQAEQIPPPPSPPPSVTSVGSLLDLDNDGFIGDDEVTFAVQLWITGQSIPRTDIVLSDEDVMEVLRLWVTGTPVG